MKITISGKKFLHATIFSEELHEKTSRRPLLKFPVFIDDVRMGNLRPLEILIYCFFLKFAPTEKEIGFDFQVRIKSEIFFEISHKRLREIFNITEPTLIKP